MDDGGPTASYIIFFVLLLIDMLFYGFGAAARELSVKELSEEFKDTKNKKAKRLYTIAVNPEQYISTVQLVVTLINLMMGGFFLQVFSRVAGNLIEKGVPQNVVDMMLPPKILSAVALVLSVAVLLYILLTFGVMIPKRLGAKYASKWAYACINPIYYITKIISPVTGLVSVTAKGILRIFGIRCEENGEDVTEEEILSMVNEGHEQGVLLATEAEMISNIFELGDKEAKDIMTHRTNILAIDRNMTLGDALDYMLSESKSRFPVYDENIDHLIGILHLRDAMRSHREAVDMTVSVGDIEGLVRDATFVPETKNIDVLFQNMQHTKTQMVIVVDEYGQTSGLVAMEDILEEIVGNIMDEYDEEEEHIEETGNANEYIIEGITPLEELEERLGISFKEGAFETLNGFMISKMDKIPEEDEEFSIDVDGYCFKILQVKNRMIQSVLVTKLAGEKVVSTEEETERKQEKKEKD
ncbi:hemolysin family protein [Parablautia muri]|uniref:HlyC/CorC family transporter n=1 Tax=Parablautia muri TaxID=2320879 RepID=A0A9X5GQE8_9FIRM|nr:hemolysin family protein [Parablautia muri]NBJ92153.1 HlyC/CorC family transporter [Parablautia muri]